MSTFVHLLKPGQTEDIYTFMLVGMEGLSWTFEDMNKSNRRRQKWQTLWYQALNLVYADHFLSLRTCRDINFLEMEPAYI